MSALAVAPAPAPPRGPRSQAQGWCFTLHIPLGSELRSPVDHEPYQWFHALESSPLRYIVFQMERCPETQRLHYQGFLFFDKKQRLSGCKKLNPTAHWEVSRAHVQAIQYCKKVETRVLGPFEYGVPPQEKQLTQDRWADVRELVKNRSSFMDILEQYPDIAFRYARGILTVADFLPPPPRPHPRVVVLYGRAGSGKTSFHTELNELFPGKVYTRNVPLNVKDASFWLNYRGEPVMVLDEFTGWLPIQQFLHLVSKADCSLNVKGAHAYAVPHLIIICSNVSPSRWYPDLINWPESYKGFQRRLTLIYKFSSDGPLLESYSFNPNEFNARLGQRPITLDDDLLYQVVDYDRLGIPDLSATIHPLSLHQPYVQRIAMRLTSDSSSSAPPPEERPVEDPIREDPPAGTQEIEDEWETAEGTDERAFRSLEGVSSLARCSPTIVDFSPRYRDDNGRMSDSDSSAIPDVAGPLPSADFESPAIYDGQETRDQRILRYRTDPASFSSITECPFPNHPDGNLHLLCHPRFCVKCIKDDSDREARRLYHIDPVAHPYPPPKDYSREPHRPIRRPTDLVGKKRLFFSSGPKMFALSSIPHKRHRPVTDFFKPSNDSSS